MKVEGTGHYEIPSGIPCGTFGTVITRNGFIRFKVECRRWDCVECRDNLWSIWEAKIDIAWEGRDRFYVGTMQKERRQLSRWLTKVGLEQAITVYAGKDGFLVIANRPFPGSQRVRKKKTLKVMKRYLFTQIDHGQNRKIVATKRFGSVLRVLITHIK
ncbi:MAG: hypothetical protein A3G93_12170 [Nitrospinae bacterium RIFCSPLOWO2_12_FULL_45_22]|nr:MAG: hypothetical protein A3G93_12170 [Nitrospinae bacterium RIFCSPLOWO2_12_FULL_45_22]